MVIDPSGAVIANCLVRLVSANGIIENTTRTDSKGAFAISELQKGLYRLIVSSPDFRTNEVPFTVRDNETPASMHITLDLAFVNATVEVQGREDDLSGIADSSMQATVGAKEIQDRPILHSGEVLATDPGVIITQHAGGGKANQCFLRGFNLDHGTDFAISSTVCR